MTQKQENSEKENGTENEKVLTMDDFQTIMARNDFEVVDGKVTAFIMGTTAEVPTEYPTKIGKHMAGMRDAFQLIYNELKNQ
jgi:hypothetical protein